MEKDYVYVTKNENLFDLSDDKSTSILANDCFQIKTDLKYRTLKAGKIYFENHFINCPIDFGNISILEINEEINYSGKVILKLLVKDYSIDFNDFIILEFCKSFFGLFNQSVSNIINLLNDFLKEGFSILDLDQESYPILIRNRLEKDNSHINAVNNLKLEFWSCCLSRVGRDNLFWTDVIITNFPNDKYLKKMIFEAFNIAEIDIDKKEITIELDSCNAFSATTPRAKFESPQKEIEIKDQIKFKMYEQYDESVHRLHKLSKKNIEIKQNQ